MNYLLMILISVSAAIPGQYRQYLAEGQYSQAMNLLSATIRENQSDLAIWAACNLELGHFYRDICGDFMRAATHYRLAARAGGKSTGPVVSRAVEALSKLKSLQLRFRELDGKLRAGMIRAAHNRSRGEIEEDIAGFEETIARHPGYYRMHEVYFTLAVNYEKLKQNKEAYRALDRAIAIKPGIVFLHPVKFKRDQAYEAYIVNTVKGAATSVCWILSILAIILFYKSRPWRWLRIRHLAAGLLLIAAWWAIFHLSHHLTGRYFDHHIAPSVAHTAQDAEDKEYLYASPGSPGSEAALPLYDYGLAGVIVIFVFSLGIRQVNSKSRRAILCCLYGTLLFTALSAKYYMHSCYGQSSFHSTKQGLMHYPTGYIKLDSDDPEPCVLTDPKSYPDLEIGNIRDPYVRDWVLRFCPFTKTDTTSQSKTGGPTP